MNDHGSPYTRLLSIAIAIALIGGGISATMTGAAAIPLLGISLLGSVCLSLISIANLIEPRPFLAMVSVIVLPIALFLYAIGLGVVVSEAPWGAYAFIALGALVAGVTLAKRPRTSRAPQGAPEMAAHRDAATA